MPDIYASDLFPDTKVQEPVTLKSVPTYADNDAAKAGGLVTGALYRTATGDLKIVY